MANCLNRRGMLQFMVVVLSSMLFGFKNRNFLDEELVCVHVYRLDQSIPEPLLAKPKQNKKRGAEEDYFNIGLPELMLCQSERKLLEMFQYFWPVTHVEITQFQRSIDILYKKPIIKRISDVEEFRKRLETHCINNSNTSKSLAVILILNAYTHQVCSEVIDICRQKDVDELIIFKNPSRSPYLCSYASQQNGFKKPPPIP